MSWRIEKDVLYPGRVVVPGGDGKPLSYTFTPADLAAIERTANAKVRDGWNIPAVYEHQEEGPDRRPLLRLSRAERDREFARGVFGAVSGFRVDGNRLKAVIEGDDDDDLKRFKKIKFVSPEIQWDWMDTDGKVWRGPTITHVAATPRPVQRRQDPVRLSQTRAAASLCEILSGAVCVGGTTHPSRLRLSLDHYAESPPMADDLDTGDTGTDGFGKGKKPSAAARIAAALSEHCGIQLGDVDNVTDLDHLATLIEVAAMNYKAGSEPDPSLDDEMPADDDMGNPDEPPGDLEQPPEGSEPAPAPPLQMSLKAQTEKAEKLARQNIGREIDGLESDRKVTPAVATGLRQKLQAIRLSFGKDGEVKPNDVTIRVEAYAANPKGAAYSLVQPKGRRGVKLSHTRGVGDSPYTPGDGKSDDEFVKEFEAAAGRGDD